MAENTSVSEAVEDKYAERLLSLPTVEEVNEAAKEEIQERLSLKTVTGQVLVEKMYLNGGVVKKEEAHEHVLEVPVSTVPVPMGKVSFGSSITTNIGNYESVKVSVMVELPCYPGEVEDCFGACKGFVDKYLGDEVAQVRQYRDERAAKMGGSNGR